MDISGKEVLFAISLSGHDNRSAALCHFLQIFAKIRSSVVVKPHHNLASKKSSSFIVVGAVGIEPTASFLSGTRSTTELRARYLLFKIF